MQTTPYGQRWNFRKHRPIDQIDEGEARRRYETGEQFAVALGEASQPEVVIEVCWKNQYLGVWFFDRFLRQSLCYTFSRADERRMFLNDITRWQYPNDEARGLNECSLIEEIRYTEGGVVSHIITDKLAAETTTTDRHSVNIDINWEDVPVFGEWASVSRYDREIGTGQSDD